MLESANTKSWVCVWMVAELLSWVSGPLPSEGQSQLSHFHGGERDQFSMALGFQDIVQHLVCLSPEGNMDHRHQQIPSAQLHQDHDMATSSSLSLVVSMALAGTSGLTDPNGLSNNVVPELQIGPGYWPRPWVAAQPSMVTGAMDINTDAGCGRTMDPDTKPLAAAWALMSLWPQVAAQATLICRALAAV